jgi:hypothetical protein
MYRHVLVTLLITTILGDEVQVILSYNDGTFHLGTNDQTLEDTPTDRNATGERTLLINVIASHSSFWCFYSQTHISYKANRLLLFATNSTLTSDKDGILALVGLFVL